MKINTLLIAAATLAVGAISSQAQVYSQNVVGYVNVSIAPNGYSLVTVPLDYDGSGTNNQVGTIFGTNLPVGSSVQNWTGSGYSGNSYSKKGWAFPTQSYNPGQGLFIFNPSNTTIPLTIAGTVLQGGLTNKYVLPNSYSLVGNQFPVAGGITSTYGYVPSIGDQVQTWNNGFSGNSYSKKGWALGEPQLGVSQAVFLLTTNLNPVWGTNFVVQ
jgi:hypothetical protein